MHFKRYIPAEHLERWALRSEHMRGGNPSLRLWALSLHSQPDVVPTARSSSKLQQYFFCKFRPSCAELHAVFWHFCSFSQIWFPLSLLPLLYRPGLFPSLSFLPIILCNSGLHCTKMCSSLKMEITQFSFSNHKSCGKIKCAWRI